MKCHCTLSLRFDWWTWVVQDWRGFEKTWQQHLTSSWQCMWVGSWLSKALTCSSGCSVYLPKSRLQRRRNWPFKLRRLSDFLYVPRWLCSKIALCLAKKGYFTVRGEGAATGSSFCALEQCNTAVLFAHVQGHLKVHFVFQFVHRELMEMAEIHQEEDKILHTHTKKSIHA